MFDSLTAYLPSGRATGPRLSDLDESLYETADLLIGNIDESGFLKASINELIFSTNAAKETIESH